MAMALSNAVLCTKDFGDFAIWTADRSILVRHWGASVMKDYIFEVYWVLQEISRLWDLSPSLSAATHPDAASCKRLRYSNRDQAV
jgi:hypothetical protein